MNPNVYLVAWYELTTDDIVERECDVFDSLEAAQQHAKERSEYSKQVWKVYKCVEVAHYGPLG